MPTYSVNLVPAYGRDYHTPAEVKRDWEAGKDFRIQDIGNQWNGSYTSIRDWAGEYVRIRFNKLADFTILSGDQS